MTTLAAEYCRSISWPRNRPRVSITANETSPPRSPAYFQASSIHSPVGSARGFGSRFGFSRRSVIRLRLGLRERLRLGVAGGRGVGGGQRIPERGDRDARAQGGDQDERERVPHGRDSPGRGRRAQRERDLDCERMETERLGGPLNTALAVALASGRLLIGGAIWGRRTRRSERSASTRTSPRPARWAGSPPRATSPPAPWRSPRWARRGRPGASRCSTPRSTREMPWRSSSPGGAWRLRTEPRWVPRPRCSRPRPACSSPPAYPTDLSCNDLDFLLESRQHATRPIHDQEPGGRRRGAAVRGRRRQPGDDPGAPPARPARPARQLPRPGPAANRRGSRRSCASASRT